MSRGGKRKGAGRKSGWNSGKTKAVKLPELLIPEIIEFARMLDQAKIDLELDEALDLLFDELVDRKILDRAAEKMIVLRENSTDLQMPETSEVTTLNRRINTSTEEDKKTLSSLSVNPPSTIEQTKTDIPLTVSLTPDQSTALEMMKQFVQTPRQKYFRLTGYAGTGKSYLIVQLMKWLRDRKINFVAGSPTNKAVKNLKKLASEALAHSLAPDGDAGSLAKVSVEAHTVAQLLGQQPELNEETGKEEFITQGTCSDLKL